MIANNSVKEGFQSIDAFTRICYGKLIEKRSSFETTSSNRGRNLGCTSALMTIALLGVGTTTSKTNKMFVEVGTSASTFRRIHDSRESICARVFGLSKDQLKKNREEHFKVVRVDKSCPGESFLLQSRFEQHF